MGRMRLVLAALGAVLFSAIAASGAIAKTERYSSGNVQMVVPGGDHGGMSAIRVPDKGHVKDVDVQLRVEGEISNMYVYLFGPNGQSVALDEEQANDGTSLGSGPNSCRGRPTTLDDESLTPLIDGRSPYNSAFQPAQPLSQFDGRRTKGRWTLALFNYNNVSIQPFDITLGCWKLKIRR
jgi:subtilisin-like proprotein convertase family protein